MVDFDGTLAPIVDDPARAEPLPSAVTVLRELAQRWGRVAVVSGRPVAYLLDRLEGCGNTELYGLYGMEGFSQEAAGVKISQDAEAWRPAVTRAALTAEADVPAGVSIERKGLAVTLHYRAAPGRQADAEALARRLAADTGLTAHAGKMSVELRPPLGLDKGTVLRSLATGCLTVLFAGDDRGDLPAFAELSRLRGGGIVTLGVAAGSAETPADVVKAADIVVDNAAGVVDLLSRLRP